MVREIFLNNDGSGFSGTPIVSISTSPSGQFQDNATAVAFTTTRANITSIEKILITNAGGGYVDSTYNYNYWWWWNWCSSYLLN